MKTTSVWLTTLTWLVAITFPSSILLADEPVAPVPPPNVTSVSISPLGKALFKGATVNLKATATYSDGTSVDITNKANWSSGTEAVATVSKDSGLVTGVSVGDSLISASFGQKVGSVKITVTELKLVSISVTPADQTIPKGIPQQFRAMGTYSDGTSFDITSRVTWSSDRTAIATVSKDAGAAIAVDIGVATITATGPGGFVSGATTLTVNQQKLTQIKISPPSATVQIGNSKQLEAVGSYTDGKSYPVDATWSSSHTNIVTIGNTGVATGIAIGDANISATFGGFSDNSTFSVVATPVASSGLSLGIGDQITLDVNMRGFRQIDDPDSVEFYAGKGTTLRIDNADKSQTKFYVHEHRTSNNTECSDEASGETSKPSGESKPSNTTTVTSSKTEKTMPWLLPAISCGLEYEVSQQSFSLHGIRSAGNEYGLLVVPYKFHINDHSLGSGGTIGAYAGLHQSEIAGVTTSFVISAGLGNVSVTSQDSTGHSTTANHSSLTVALGEITTLTKSGSFQLGLLIGWDFAGKSSGYEYESKPWLALSFGVNLTK